MYLLSASLAAHRAQQRATRINDLTSLGLSALHLREVSRYALTYTAIVGALTPAALHAWHVDLLAFVPIVVLNHAAEDNLTGPP